ncbi:MAG: hypothetical protein ACRD68_01830 [Pyrinomonadaceae bacterium]
MLLSAVLIARMPLQLSIVTVFLFAGPHNWAEFRYFVSRMPVRWGRSRNFFAVAIGGAILLTLAFAAWPQLARARGWEANSWLTATALWNSLLVVWVGALVMLRAGESSRQRDWSWCVPAGLALVALAWLFPQGWGLALVYLHPLLALWFLDRQLRRSRPAWLFTYRTCLACLPLLLAVMWWLTADAPPLPDADDLAFRITQHAGAGVLTDLSSHLLVATHVYLETIHYAVWLVAIPLVGLRTAPWRMKRIPLATHPRGWPRATAALLVAGALVVLLLWVCFPLDYPTTRDLYFTAAMLHVLAEVPFLLRLL